MSVISPVSFLNLTSAKASILKCEQYSVVDEGC